MGSKTQPARGMRDFLPADVRRREYVIGIIKEVYERYGFEPLETPAVENIETLMGKYGEEGNQLIFKILKRGVHESSGEADLALRYDLTVPLARVVAEYRDKLPKFFKRYQIQPVWRADRPARGRFREFYQCDVDVLGSKSMVVEAEICAAISDVLTRLGFMDFVILLNHRKVLEKIMDVAGIDPDQFQDAVTAFDKLDKIGIEGVRKEFEDHGILFAYDHLVDLLVHDLNELSTEYEKEDNDTWNQEMLARLPMAMGGSEEAQSNQGLNELKSIIRYAARTSANGRIRLAPNLARGLSYYTGPIMEVSIGKGIGSLGGGGRYDNLVGMFLGDEVPACGFSLGLERIIVVMTERGMFPEGLVSSPADVMISVWNEESLFESLALANELRGRGLRVDLYPEADKIGKQFKYASAREIPFVAVLGDDEKERGEVGLKDLRSGEQRTLKRESLADAIRGKP